VRTILDHLGLKVNRLIRISFGPFQLRDLEAGGVEPVKRRVLVDQLGRRVAAELGFIAEDDAADARTGAGALAGPSRDEAAGAGKGRRKGEQPPTKG
jgi:23S rRNA pseudouridine2605 synthase